MKGSTITARMKPAVRMPSPSGGPANSAPTIGDLAEVVSTSSGCTVDLQHRRQNEQAPDAVDDARDRGQQLDQGADRPAQPGRAQLGQEHGDRRAPTGTRDHHGDQRGDKRTVDRRQRAEELLDRVPWLAPQKPEAEGLEGRQRAHRPARTMHRAAAAQHADCEEPGGAAEQRILERAGAASGRRCRKPVPAYPARPPPQLPHLFAPGSLPFCCTAVPGLRCPFMTSGSFTAADRDDRLNLR